VRDKGQSSWDTRDWRKPSAPGWAFRLVNSSPTARMIKILASGQVEEQDLNCGLKNGKSSHPLSLREVRRSPSALADGQTVGGAIVGLPSCKSRTWQGAVLSGHLGPIYSLAGPQVVPCQCGSNIGEIKLRSRTGENTFFICAFKGSYICYLVALN